jgi:hypothetical protein
MTDWGFAVGRGACARGPAHPSPHDLQSFEPEAKIDCRDRRQHQNVRVIFQSQLKRHVDRNPQTPTKAKLVDHLGGINQDLERRARLRGMIPK